MAKKEYSQNPSAIRARRHRARRKKGMIANVQIPVVGRDILALMKWGGLPQACWQDRKAIASALRKLLSAAADNAHKQRVT